MAMTPPQRRRLYLMRHGSVDYFTAEGKPIPPDGVCLNARGRAQADAAGAVFAQAGVRFDRVVVSGLPRTVETAQRVLAAAGQELEPQIEPALQEIRSGRLADIAPHDLERAFLGAFGGGFTAPEEVEAMRFMGGESVGELLDRVLPAFEHWRNSGEWDCMLMVLHGGVNRAILSSALAGRRAFFGGFEQAPACINVLDVGTRGTIVRATNLAAPTWLQHDVRHTTMEELLSQYVRQPA